MSLFIRAKYILTNEEKGELIQDGAVYVEDDRIHSVGKADELGKKFKSQAERCIEGPHHLVIPGFISLHTHSVAAIVRGLGPDTSLMSWLENVKWRYQRHLNNEEAYHAALLSGLEAIQSGVTTIVDSYYPCRENPTNADSILEAHRDSGIRATLARTFMDRKQKAPEIFIQDQKISRHRRFEKYIATNFCYSGEDK